jgi:toxin ParE1/3/4
MRFDWLPQALADFDEIIDYIAEENPDAAIQQGDEIHSQIASLSGNPKLGRPGRVKGTRELVIVRTPYIAAYRVKNNEIVILRILHGARQWPDRF